MEIVLTTKAMSVLEPLDAEHFKVIVNANRDRLAEVKRRHAAIVTFESTELAWVGIEALQAWPVLEDMEKWRGVICAMVEEAAPRGWIDAARQSIRTHVEWAAD